MKDWKDDFYRYQQVIHPACRNMFLKCFINKVGLDIWVFLTCFSRFSAVVWMLSFFYMTFQAGSNA